MKKSLPLGSLIILSVFLSTHSADATVITSPSMATVADGQSGTVTTPVSQTPITLSESIGTEAEEGVLPSDSEITFTYTLSGILGPSLQADASYTNPQTNVTTSSNASTSSPATDVNALLLSTSANLGSPGGTLSIANTSSTFATFNAVFAGLFSGSASHVAISYAVSAVPLPGALPMFATLLASLAAFNWLRKNRKGFGAA